MIYPHQVPVRKLVLLEDDIDDRILIRRTLTQLDFMWDLRTCDNEVYFTILLEEFQPDVIVADYRLPGWSGLEALLLAQDMCPGVPFIFLTGVIQEELAEQTALAGASSLVLKSNLGQLPQAIEAVLTETDPLSLPGESSRADHSPLSDSEMHRLLLDIKYAWQQGEDLSPYMEQIDALGLKVSKQLPATSPEASLPVISRSIQNQL